MDKFASRQPIEEVHNMNPEENIERLRELLNELAELGWDSNQWSSKLPDDDDQAFLKLEPNFNNLTSKEKSRFIRENIEKLPRYYFIESFGHPEYGYLRAGGKCLVECAEKLIRSGQNKLNCVHNWLYTHNNGNKTCGKCRAFVRCTVEEALANYETGSVKVNEHLSLYFHNKRPICSCGSHKMYYLKDSMFNDKQFQCVSCQKYWPLKFRTGEYAGLPVHPNDDGYENASLDCQKKIYSRHRFMSLGVMSEAFLKQHITRYIFDMLKHFYNVENGTAIEEFVNWVKPYVYKAVKDTETQISINKVKYELKGIKELEIKIQNKEIEITYDLITELPVKVNEDPEIVLKNVFEAFLNNVE